MRALVVMAALLTAACATPCPAVNTAPTNADFHCDDGSTLHVTFINAPPQSAVIGQDGYTTISLPLHIFGAGFRYAANGAEFSGRAGEAHWTRPGAAETICRETP